MKYTPEQWALAVHEAGHAVAAAVLDVPFKRPGLVLEQGAVSTLEPDTEEPVTSPEQGESLQSFALKVVVIKFSGVTAQVLLRAPGASDQIRDMAAARTFSAAVFAADSVEQVLAGASEMSAEIIQNNEEAVRVVATALLKRGRFSAHRVGRAVGVPVRVEEDWPRFSLRRWID